MPGKKKKALVNAMLIPVFCASSLVFLALSEKTAPAAPVPPQKDWSIQMPDGAGKKLIVAQCELCHTLERVVTSHRSKDDWQAVIELMIEQGATLTDAESKTVVDYLAANFGPKSATAPSATSATPVVSASQNAVPTMIVEPAQAQFVTPADSLGLPPGAQVSMLSGDFSKPGMFSALFKFPSDQRIEPHSQSADLDMVVLRGALEIGNGTAYDAGRLQAVNPGEIVHLPAQSYEFGHTKQETIVLLYGVGPLSVNWASK